MMREEILKYWILQKRPQEIRRHWVLAKRREEFLRYRVDTIRTLDVTWFLCSNCYFEPHSHHNINSIERQTPWEVEFIWALVGCLKPPLYFFIYILKYNRFYFNVNVIQKRWSDEKSQTKLANKLFLFICVNLLKGRS